MSLVTDLPAIFDHTYCTFMPQEIPMAAGAVVVSLCSTSDETIEEAEKDLPRNLCPLIKSSYGFGKTDKCPYFYFSDLVVGETTCDGKKKMYEYMAEFKPVHVMQLPNSVKDDASRALWKAEMLRLQKTVEERFGLDCILAVGGRDVAPTWCLGAQFSGTRVRLHLPSCCSGSGLAHAQRSHRHAWSSLLYLRLHMQ
ncbi:MAG: 2-hydroxyacyl-CoA dehydratase, partial [Escherichia coli]|nr:2-hydroxyacyl-CoA dehydratase [Escherichia coli]